MTERTFTVQAPDGNSYQVRARQDATDAELIQMAQAQATMRPIEKKPATFWQAALASPLGAFARGSKDFIDAGAQLLPRGVSFVASAGGMLPNRVSEWADSEVARVDSMNREGNRTYEDARFATGREGFDGFRFAGNVVGPGGVGVARAMSRAAPAAATASILARAKTGAIGGVVGGLMTPVFNTDETSFGMQKTGQVLAGGVGGGIASPVLGKMIDGLAPIGKRIAASFASGDTISRQASGQVDDAISAVLTESGADISPAVRQQLTKQVSESLKKGQRLDAASALRKMDFDAEGLPALLGQVTRDPKQFSTERNLFGVDGIGDDIRNVLRTQNSGINTKLSRLGGTSAAEPFRAGEDMIGGLSKVDEQMAASVRSAYRNARASSGKDWDIPMQGLAQDAAEVIDNFGVGAERNALPSAIAAKLKDFGVVGDPGMTQKRVFNFEEADKLLKQINSHASGGPNASLDALRAAVKRSMLDAGENAADPFALPRKMAAERFKLMEAVPALKAAADGSVAPDDFVRRYIIDGKTKEVQKLASLLPAEARTEAKKQLAAKIYRDAFGENLAGDKAVRPEMMAKALRNIGTDKLKAFFNAQEIEQLQRIARISAYVGSDPVASAVSRGSNTGGALFNQLGRLPGMSGTVSMAQALSRPFVQGSEASRALRATVPQVANLTPNEIAAASGLLNATGFAAGGLLAPSP
jgi:hypothetical protein